MDNEKTLDTTKYERLIDYCESVSNVFDCSYRIYTAGSEVYSKAEDSKSIKEGIEALCYKIENGVGFVVSKNLFYVAVKEHKSESLYIFGAFERIGIEEPFKGIPTEYVSFDSINSNEIFTKAKMNELANMLNIAINGEKIIDDEPLNEVDQLTTSKLLKEINDFREQDAIVPIGESYEKKLMYLISNGLTEDLSSLDSEEVRTKIANYGGSYIRTLKNNMIVQHALIYRAAKSGGIERAVANALNKHYSRKIEACNTVEQLTELSESMRYDYCQGVKKAKETFVDDPMIQHVKKYVLYNLYKKIEAEDIAKDLKISNSYLSRKFKACLNMSVPQYINQLKINEAKKLILFSDKSLSEISALLAFSSQSYFQQIFKKTVGMTPTEYKKSEYREGLFF